MDNNSRKISITKDMPCPTDKEVSVNAPETVDEDVSQEKSTNVKSVSAPQYLNTTVEIVTLTDQPVKYNITVKLNNEKPSVPPELTVGETIEALVGSSNNQFHSNIGKSKAVSKEFSASKLLLGTFDKFTKQPALSRDDVERESEIRKRISQISGLSIPEINKLEKVMSVQQIKKTNVADFSTASYQKAEDVCAMPSIPCSNGWHRTMMTQYKKRKDNVPQRLYGRVLKYSGDKASIERGMKYKNVFGNNDLIPGENFVYHIRLYKTFNYLNPNNKDWTSNTSSRFSRTGRGVGFQQDFLFLGTQTLCHLRDSIRCPNDLGPQQDLSQTPDDEYIIDLKRVFPSAFLFINNIFYNDMRNKDSVDISKEIREWAEKEGIAKYEHRSMEGVTFNSLNIRLGHPEVYIHQGECEHLFTISKVRVLQPTDICVSSMYPHSTGLNPYYTVNCIICTKLGAKWIVTSCDRIPFDPAFVCAVCFKLYLYIDGKKVGNFKAYRYQMKNMTTDTF